MKPGYKTTEFYVTIGTVLVSLAGVLGVIAPEDQNAVAEAVKQAVLGLAATITAVVYIWGRTMAKIGNGK